MGSLNTPIKPGMWVANATLFITAIIVLTRGMTNCDSARRRVTTPLNCKIVGDLYYMVQWVEMTQLVLMGCLCMANQSCLVPLPNLETPPICRLAFIIHVLGNVFSLFASLWFFLTINWSAPLSVEFMVTLNVALIVIIRSLHLAVWTQTSKYRASRLYTPIGSEEL